MSEKETSIARWRRVQEERAEAREHFRALMDEGYRPDQIASEFMETNPYEAGQFKAILGHEKQRRR